MVYWKMYAQCALLAFMLTPTMTIFIEACSSLAIACAVYCCIDFPMSCVAKPDMADHLTCGGTDGKPLVLHNLQPLRSSHSHSLLLHAFAGGGTGHRCPGRQRMLWCLIGPGFAFGGELLS